MYIDGNSSLEGVYAFLRQLEHTDLANEYLLQLLPYGDEDFPDSVNRHIFELTLNYQLDLLQVSLYSQHETCSKSNYP